MKLFKKIITAVLSVCCLVGATACGGGGGDSSSIKMEANFEYNDYLGTGYNKEMCYQNHGLVQAADPSVITVGDTFYMYATNANEEGDCSYIQGWQSKNLSDWTPMGNVFVPKRDSWAVHSLWAPEVIKKGDTYYMYYSGYNISTGKMGIGLATSSSPNGPFKEIEGTYGGKTYSHTKMPIDLGFKAIDASPFIDDDGKIYLYVSKDQVDRVSSVYACELE